MSKDTTIEEIKEILKQTAIVHAETVKENEERRRENEERFRLSEEREAKRKAELNAIIEEMKQDTKALKKQMGNITNNQGDMVEEFVHNSIKYHNNKLWGVQFDDIEFDLKNKVGKTKAQYDVVLYNGNTIAIVEVKSKAHQNDLNGFAKKVEDFRVLFPMYKDYKIHIGIAAVHINDDVITACKAKGYGVVSLSGNPIYHQEVTDNIKAF